MDNPKKDESPPGPAVPSDRESSFPLDLVDKAARQDASQRHRDKTSGIMLSVHTPIRTSLKKEPQVVENPWKAGQSSSDPHVGGEEGATVPEHTAPDSTISEEPAEKGDVESRNETTTPADGGEIKQTEKPTSIMEVFMAAKKKGRPSKKSSASIAMGNALDRQEKKSSAIEKMIDKNIAAETSRAKARATSAKVKTSTSKPKEKRPLADIVSEVASRKDSKKAAPRAAKTTAKSTAKAAAKVRVEPKKAAPAPAAKETRPKRQPRVRPSRAASGPVEVVVESLASGLISLLSGAVGGVIGAGKVAGQAVSTGAKYVAEGTKSVAEKVKATVKPDRSEKAEKGEGPVASAAKTAARVTKEVADGLSSGASGAVKVSGQVVSGVATVAGYTVKGGIAIVSDTAGALINTAGGLLNMLIGPKKKRRKTA